MDDTPKQKTSSGSPQYVTAWGETKNLQQWSQDERCRVSRTALLYRLSEGIAPETAMTTPPATTRPSTLSPEEAKIIRDHCESTKSIANLMRLLPNRSRKAITGFISREIKAGRLPGQLNRKNRTRGNRREWPVLHAQIPPDLWQWIRNQAEENCISSSWWLEQLLEKHRQGVLVEQTPSVPACPKCQSEHLQKDGFDRRMNPPRQRYRCRDCNTHF